MINFKEDCVNHWLESIFLSGCVFVSLPILSYSFCRRLLDPIRNKVWRGFSFTIDNVCFLGGSRRQVNNTPQKGFVRPEHLLEGKVSWGLEVWVYVCVFV